jgi:DNA-binding transcriptional MerR regulator
VAAKLQQFAKDKDIKDQAKLLAAYFKDKLPDEKPPATIEEQMKLLRQREQVPEAKLKELEDKRVAATKERLVKTEGIQDKRLPVGAPKKPGDAAAEGGVEFAIGEGEAE